MKIFPGKSTISLKKFLQLAKGAGINAVRFEKISKIENRAGTIFRYSRVGTKSTSTSGFLVPSQCPPIVGTSFTKVSGTMPLPLHTSNGENIDPASREAGRFENFYQDILELQEVLERVENFTVRRRMREIISRLEGILFILRLGHYIHGSDFCSWLYFSCRLVISNMKIHQNGF